MVIRITRITDDLYLRSADRPACYLVSLVDSDGHSPTPIVISDEVELARLYCTRDLDTKQSEIVMEMERAIGSYEIARTGRSLAKNLLAILPQLSTPQAYPLGCAMCHSYQDHSNILRSTGIRG